MKRFLLFWAACLPLAAEEMAVNLNSARSSIAFTLGAALHTVHGSFKLKRGSMHFDTETGHAGGEIVVDASSGVTGIADRDKRMRKDVLETDRFPEISFLPDRVAGGLLPSAESPIDLHGVFQILGARHEMTLHFLVRNQNGGVTAASDFTIPYIDWGLKNPSTFLLKVSATVQVRILAAGSIARVSNAEP
ncbi:MAG TPA: YceI family protein [Bryobacteraceae bacterium]|nr:YceI family protein [Bryobacteraceae bacterium]